MSRFSRSTDWEAAWAEDEDALQEDEDAGDTSQPQQHGRTADTAYFTATSGLEQSSIQNGNAFYEDEEDVADDEHAAGAYDGYGGGGKGDREYEEEEEEEEEEEGDRAGSALDPAFLRVGHGIYKLALAPLEAWCRYATASHCMTILSMCV
jgi:hypothetical protein